MRGKSLREVVGFAGVVGSLVFVGLEIRQNTLATRAAANQNMGTAISAVWLETAQDPERSLLTLQFLDDRSMELTPTEEAQLANQSIAALRQYEVIWRQVELGLLGPEVLTYFGFEPGGIATGRIWPRIRDRMSPDFRAFLEESAAAR